MALVTAGAVLGDVHRLATQSERKSAALLANSGRQKHSLTHGGLHPMTAIRSSRAPTCQRQSLTQSRWLR